VTGLPLSSLYAPTPTLILDGSVSAWNGEVGVEGVMRGKKGSLLLCEEINQQIKGRFAKGKGEC